MPKTPVDADVRCGHGHLLGWVSEHPCERLLLSEELASLYRPPNAGP